MIGEPRPIYQGGILVGHEIVKSDRLLETMLKGHLPAMFRENHQVELKVEAKVEISHTTPQQVMDITNALLPRLAAKINGQMN